VTTLARREERHNGPRTRPRFVARVDDPSAFIVSFVVDTLGIPEARSLKVLHAPSEAAAVELRVAFPSWRFSSAIANGCRVPQVLQTSVER